MTATIFDFQTFLKTVTSRPGVYTMYNLGGEVLYVGKAKNLKKRLTSYFNKQSDSLKTQSLVKQIHDIQVTITQTENEALLLECNLIKSLSPRYNVLFRDDKTYPYIFCSLPDEFPRLSLMRGRKPPKGRSFGPYPSAGSARASLNLLQKLFKIRQCSNTFFRNRTRPCLQYQIKRCSAPCVGYIAPEKYRQDVQHALLFLDGKNTKVIEELIARMEASSNQQEYEEAALYRNQIANLRELIQQQVISAEKGDVDVVAIVADKGLICVQLLYIRKGQMIGNRAYFPKAPADATLPEIYAEFLPQYYLTSAHLQDIPKEIIIEQDFNEREWICGALSEKSGKKVMIVCQVRSEKAKWLIMAKENALSALHHRLSDKLSLYQRFMALQEVLGLDSMPQRLECFDISHSMGEATVASCVVFDMNGPLKSDYRHFNIKDIIGGDDYAAMYQVLTRRYKRLKQGEGKLPNLIVIDGGKGQLTQAQRALEELQVVGVCLLSIAKGEGRKSGLETLYISGREQGLNLVQDSPAFHLLQHIRDEAHRFAITAHRQRRDKKRNTSTLESIDGIGAKKRRDLLKHFGGLQPVLKASVEELSKVPGISKNLAQKIFDSLHAD